MIQTMSDLLRALAGLNVWGFAGLCVLCGTYAYTQRLRADFHERIKTGPLPLPIQLPPDVAPAQEITPPGPPIPEPKPPSSGRLFSVILVLFGLGTVLRMVGTVGDASAESSLVHAADRKQRTNPSPPGKDCNPPCQSGQRCEHGRCVSDAHKPPPIPRLESMASIDGIHDCELDTADRFRTVFR
jgi:hypothetical protein